MAYVKDYTGKKFNKLTCVERIRKNNRTYYICKCDCGNTREVRGDCLLHNHTTSCGKCIINTYDLTGEYGVGYTTNQEEYYFDLENYEKIKDYNWRKTDHGYIATNIEGKHTYMHVLLLGKKKNKNIDHANGRKHDNKISNLRHATQSENTINKLPGKRNTSGTVGVFFEKSRNKWCVQITKEGNTHSLGRYDSKEEAIQVRIKKEIELFGEFSPHYE